MFKYIDIHAHLNFAAFDNDREVVVRRALDAGVALINVGTDKETSQKAVSLAEGSKNGIWSIIGLHPTHTKTETADPDEVAHRQMHEGEEFDYDWYRALAQHPKVVGIGECGLDYFRLEASSTKDKQVEAFRHHITLANELKKPLMLHIRNAYRDALEILRSEAKVGGDVHFFAGTWEEAQKFLDLGFTLSFTGVITFAKDYEEVIKNTPLTMLQAETDCPYVAPMPYRGKRNESAYVVEVVKKIAQIKGLPEEKVQLTLLENARRVFGLSFDF